MTDVWFTSDTHYGHANIVRLAERPFDDVKAMDEALIANFNIRVKPGDMCFHLGDFAFGGREKVTATRSRLNGQIHLILGNHDNRAHVKDAGFAWVGDYKEIKSNGRNIVLCHYALRVWNKSHRGALNLFGHSHASLPGNDRQLDVGVDAWDYQPINLDEILDRMSRSPAYVQEDGHAPR